MERPPEHTFEDTPWRGESRRQPTDPYAPPPEHAAHATPASPANPPPYYAPPPGYTPPYAATPYPQQYPQYPQYPQYHQYSQYPPASAAGIAPPGYMPPPAWGMPIYAPAPAMTAPTAPSANVQRPTGTTGNTRGRAAGWVVASAVALKVLLPFLSVIVSLGAYALLFGWQLAVGIIALLFVHEMGHFIVIRAKGLPASLPVFIPLIGAYVAMRKMPRNVRDEAEIAIAGPVAGALGGLACWLIFEQTDLRIWLILAYFSFFINLLNLIPVSPFDGGRVVGAISRWFWILGLVLMGVGFFLTQSIFLLILAVLGFSQTIQRFRMSPAQAAYYKIPLLSRIWVTAAYFGLAGLLAVGMVAAEQMLMFTR